jgi:hypothetical protein
MSKIFTYVAALIVAGLALISLSPGNVVEKLSNLGISLLAAAIVMATQLQKNELAMIRWLILGLIFLFIIAIVIIRMVT